ncbi:MAG: molybdopterin-dependent oxidoreductase [Myxococcales bacterium]|nr:molybdopterin-dependent oxidoreductase [Myxococcales bacterium]
MSDASRRDFLKLTVVAGAAAGQAACSELVPQERIRPRPGPEERIKTACGACSAGCGLTVRKVGENAVQLEGLPGHPLNGGGLCPRGVAEIQNLYHPERLRGPMRAAGQRGSGRFQPIDWDTALGTVAEKAKGGGVLLGLGDVSAVERILLARIASASGWKLVQAATPLGQPPLEALRGALGSDEYSFDVAHSDCVLALGHDFLQASPSLAEAQRAALAVRTARPVRGRMIYAGPRLSVTAMYADRWIPVAPGGLAHLALSVAHAILADQARAALERFEAVSARATDFLAFRELVTQPALSPSKVGPELGIPERVILELASELLAWPRPLVMVDRADHDLQLAGMALNVLLGAVDREGGVVSRAPLNLPAELRAPQVETSDLPKSDQAQAVLLYGANPLYLWPSGEWSAALERAAFVASFGPFADESAAEAEILLPTSTALESRQLSLGHAMDGAALLTAGPAAVEKLYDTLEGPEALIRLAQKLGVELPWKDAGEYLSAFADAVGASELLEEGGFKVLATSRVHPAEAETPPTGAPVRLGAEELRGVKAAGGEGLSLEIYVPSAFNGGLGAHLPYLHGIAGTEGREAFRTLVVLHPKAAAEAEVKEAAPVYVQSPRGRIAGIARLSDAIRPDAVAIALGLGRRALGHWAEGHGANPLTLLSEDSRGYGGVGWRCCRVKVGRLA